MIHAASLTLMKKQMTEKFLALDKEAVIHFWTALKLKVGQA